MQGRARAWGAGAQEARCNGLRSAALSQAQGIQNAVRTHPHNTLPAQHGNLSRNLAGACKFPSCLSGCLIAPGVCPGCVTLLNSLMRQPPIPSKTFAPQPAPCTLRPIPPNRQPLIPAADQPPRSHAWSGPRPAPPPSLLSAGSPTIAIACCPRKLPCPLHSSHTPGRSCPRRKL